MGAPSAPIPGPSLPLAPALPRLGRGVGGAARRVVTWARRVRPRPSKGEVLGAGFSLRIPRGRGGGWLQSSSCSSTKAKGSPSGSSKTPCPDSDHFPMGVGEGSGGGEGSEVRRGVGRYPPGVATHGGIETARVAAKGIVSVTPLLAVSFVHPVGDKVSVSRGLSFSCLLPHQVREASGEPAETDPGQQGSWFRHGVAWVGSQCYVAVA